MNQAYRVLWNEATSTFVPVAETARARGRRSSPARCLRALMASALVAPGAANALDVTAPSRFDITNYTAPGMTTVVDDGGTVNLTGLVVFAKQDTGGERISYPEAQARGHVTGADLSDYNQLLMSDTTPIPVRDDVTGNIISVPVYTTFEDIELGSRYGSGSANTVTVFSGDATPYVNARLATVSNGKLNINLHQDSPLDLGAAKQTSLVLVDGTKGTAAEANWSSGNYVSFGNPNMMTASEPFSQNLTATTYVGTFFVTDVHGNVSPHTVTNAAQLQSYNVWIIDAMKSGDIAASDYTATLQKAYTQNTVTVTLNPVGSDVAPNSPLYLPVDNQALLHANGPDAIARVTTAADAPIRQGYGTTLLATNGGTVINDGRIGVQADLGVAMAVYRGDGVGSTEGTGSLGINNGVLTVGYSSSLPDASVPATATVFTGYRNLVDGAGSELKNNGIINSSVANNGSTVNTVAVGARNGGQFVNHGAMNLGVNGTLFDTTGQPIGIDINTGGSVINASDGVIYVGRGASGDLSGGSMAAGGADTIVNGNKDSNMKAGNAIQVGGTDSKVDNQGTIVLGSGVQGGAGIYVGGGARAA